MLSDRKVDCSGPLLDEAAVYRIFDVYILEARLRPALMAISPAVVSLVLLWPADVLVWRSISVVLVICGAAVLLTHLARARGRTLEIVLFERWGGKPTTALLRHRDTRLDANTKLRYLNFLSSHVPGWQPPTAQEEKDDAQSSDARFDSAIRWLLEYSRDRRAFPLVFAENVSYGFRKNLLGLKPIGMAIAIASILTTIFLIYLEVANRTAVTWLVLCYDICAVLTWVWLVRSNWVKGAADAYAHCLLAVADAGEAPNRRKRRQAKTDPGLSRDRGNRT